MSKTTNISHIQNQLQKALPEAIFEQAKQIKYRNAANDICEIEVELYDHINQLVVLIDNTKRECLVSDLISSGYIPIEYSNREIRAQITEKSIDKNQLLSNQHETNKLMTAAVIGGYSEIPIAEEINVVVDTSSDTINMSNYGMNREEIQDLIGKSPGWLLRSGITLVFFVSIVLLFFASIIKYPDKISSTGVLTSHHPPVAVSSKITCRVEELFVSNGDLLQNGDPILYLKNTVDRNDVELLQSFMSNYQESSTGSRIHLDLPQHLSLGQMQSLYGQLFLKFKEYKQILGNRIAADQIENIERETNQTAKLNRTLIKEADMYDEERSLIEKDFQRQEQLFKDGVISEQELEKSAAILSQYERQKEAMQKTTIQNEIRKEALSLEKNKIIEQRFNSLQQYRFAIAELIESLKMAIIDWEYEYFVKAESDGHIELSTTISPNIRITPETVLGYIMSAKNEDEKYIRALVKAERKGKIEKGSKVIVKFDAYPYKEFGVVVSQVERLSLLSTKIDQEQNKFYELIVPINDLRTEYDEHLEFTPEMSAIIEIITEDRTILGRIMERFYDLIQNR